MGTNAIIKNAATLMKSTQVLNLNTPSMEDVLNQVTNKITQLKDGATQKLTMVLRPNDLGRLSIELISNQNGLTTQIMAQNENVRAYIEKNIDSLRQQLSEAGVNVNSIQIKTAGSEGSTNYEGNQNFTKEQQENLNQQNNKDNQNNQQKNDNRGAKEALASMSNYDMQFAKDFSSILNKSLNYNFN
jgi:flagellar hook-length control protein FliK